MSKILYQYNEGDIDIELSDDGTACVTTDGGGYYATDGGEYFAYLSLDEQETKRLYLALKKIYGE